MGMTVRTEKVYTRVQEVPLFVLIGTHNYVPISDISSISITGKDIIEIFFNKPIRIRTEEDTELEDGEVETHSVIDSVTGVVLTGEEAQIFLEYFKDVMYPHPSEDFPLMSFGELQDTPSFVEAAQLLYLKYTEKLDKEDPPAWEELEPDVQVSWVEIVLELRGESIDEDDDSDSYEENIS